MEFDFLRLLLRLVELGAVHSSRVTQEKIFIIIENNRPTIATADGYF